MYTYEIGTFIVDSQGEVEVDYLFDGGWFRGELAVFSLNEMESFTPGSQKFMLEAARRALTNSEEGHIIIQDELEGALFSADLGYERNFNTDPENYQGVKTFSMIPGDEIGFMMTQHTTVQETYSYPDNIYQPGKLPIFSMPEANLLDSSEKQFEFVDVDGNGTIALEDVLIQEGQGDKDYNDLIYQVQGLEGNLPKLENHINSDFDWRSTRIGMQLLNFTDSRAQNDDDTDNNLIQDGDIVYRFDRTDSRSQLYTTSEEERDSVQKTLPQYEYKGESFMGAPNREGNDISGILPVYRFLDINTGDHFYTASNIEKDFVTENLSNYTPEGIAFYGYESQQVGSVPVYRFYNESLDAHFYTPSIEERNEFLTAPNYQPEGNEDGIAFYVQPIEI